ncbi:MAG: glycosyl hydrolase 53 family protein, partial [Lachnospiraceae bacterium]|nr:glycosyl hydrolase 53 family protein [Lachnospiraceae bacterium]
MLILSMAVAGCAGGGMSTESASGSSTGGEGQTVVEESTGAAEARVQWSGREVEKQIYTAQLPTAKESAEIFVEPIPGLSDDFIRGMDVSTVIVEEESGVVYRDENGQEKDLFEILADAGVNYIRVRVWNNPYDADG